MPNDNTSCPNAQAAIEAGERIDANYEKGCGLGEQINITKTALDAGMIVHVGWSLGRDIAEQCGVNVDDYFDLDGNYLGPDANGLEPIFSKSISE